MKYISLLIVGLVLIMSACKDKSYYKYEANVPIYQSFESFRKGIDATDFTSPKTITEKGNIYFKDNYLFIIDTDKGIHFIDNANPNNPVNKGYLAISGITGMEIDGNYLYANNLIDLVVIDISSIQSPIEVGRVNNVFSESLPLHDINYPIAELDRAEGVVVGWKIEEVTSEKTEMSNNNSFVGQVEYDVSVISNGAGGGSNQGVSGSITKFTLLNGYLYVMDGFMFKPFDLANPIQPVNTNEVQINRVVETLFSYNNHVFMGTRSGMLIYETVNQNSPSQVGRINHVRACDPVVVSGNYAYVTLRTGSLCGGQINQLDVIDISNYASPQLKKSFNLNNPNGLGIIDSYLFVCDGTAGLKVFDAKDPIEVGNNLIKEFSNIQATDIILIDKVAILIGDDGLRQYDINDINNITSISFIPFN